MIYLWYLFPITVSYRFLQVILYFSKIVNLGLTQLRVFCFVLFLKNTLCKALLDGEGSNVNSKIKVARTFPLSLKGWQNQMYG